MPARVTGMISGMDTESLIQDLVKAKGSKVRKLEGNKTKATWKQDKWKELNKKLKSLQATANNLRYSSSFLKKTTKSSNESAVSVITGEGAMNSVQKLSIINLASSGYLTGDKISSEGGSVSKTTKLSDLICKDSAGKKVEGLEVSTSGSFTVTTGGKSKTISFNEDTSIDEIVRELNSAGVSANFDAKNQRIFIGAKASGKDADFSITADNASGLSAMSLLGINAEPSEKSTVKAEYDKLASYYSTYSAMSKEDAIASISSDVDSEIYKMLKAELKDKDDTDYDAAYDRLFERLSYANTMSTSGAGFYNSGAARLYGEDAMIELNDAIFTSSTNNIEVNGLTFQCHAKASDITITTEDDTDGVYDMIKSFIKEYNEIINELDSLYNADAVKGFEPLTDEEKDAMSETEIEKYEDKIKGALFRKDSTMSLVFNGLKEIMSDGYKVGDKKMYLGDFGIATLNYFNAAEFEKGAYHIDGDSDDSETSGNADKLKSMIAADPSSVVSFFTGLSNALYSKMSDLSKSSSTSSYGSFYDDKQMKLDLADFESKITDAQDKLNDYEDKFYAKFAAMEKALSKMQSSQSYLAGLFGQQQ